MGCCEPRGESGRTACHHHAPIHFFLSHSLSSRSRSILSPTLSSGDFYTREPALPTHGCSVSFLLSFPPSFPALERIAVRVEREWRVRKMPVIRRDLRYAPRRRDEAEAARIRTRGRASSRRRTPRDLEKRAREFRVSDSFEKGISCERSERVDTSPS